MDLYAVFIRRPRYFRAFQRIHRKRESQHHVNGCKFRGLKNFRATRRHLHFVQGHFLRLEESLCNVPFASTNPIFPGDKKSYNYLDLGFLNP